MIDPSPSPGKIRIWDTTTGKAVSVFDGHSDQVRRLIYSPDGKRIVSITGGGTQFQPGEFMVRDAETGKILHSKKYPNTEINAVACSPDGKWVVLGMGREDRPGVISLLNLDNAEEVGQIRAHEKPVLTLAFSSDGRRLASDGADRLVKVWSTHGFRETESIKGHLSWIEGLAFDAEGRFLATCDADGLFKVWDLSKGLESDVLHVFPSDINESAVSADGRLLAVATRDKHVAVWDVVARKQLAVIPNSEELASSLTFVANDACIAIAYTNGKVRVVSVRDGSLVRTLSAGVSELIRTSPEQPLTITDPTSGQSRIFKGKAVEVLGTSMAYRAYDQRLLCVYQYRMKLKAPILAEVTAWDVGTGKQVVGLLGSGNWLGRQHQISPTRPP